MKKSVFVLISIFVFSLSVSSFAESVIAWGDNSYGQCDAPQGSDYVSVAAGEYHSLAIRDGVNPITAWGLNDFGQCDVEYRYEDFSDIAAGGHTSIGMTNYAFNCLWGNMHSSQWEEGKVMLLDIGSRLRDYVYEHETTTDNLSDLGYNGHVLNGEYFTIADFVITTVCYDPSADPNLVFTVAAFNSNLVPEVVTLDQDGKFEPDNEGGCIEDYNDDNVKVSVGKWHVIEINDGSIESWPDDTHGQVLGMPAGNDFVDVSAYNWNSLALRSDGTITAWGWTDSIVWGEGKVFMEMIADGLRAYAKEHHAVPVVGPGNYEAIGLEDSDLTGDFFTSAEFSVPSLTYNMAFDPDIWFTIRADSTDGVSGSMEMDEHWVWTEIGVGDNSSGQLNVPAGNDFVAIDSGGYHCLALKDDGSIVAWGDNHFGQCDVPSGNDFVKISAGGKHSLALRENGSIVAWGDDRAGQVSNTPLGIGAIDISAGEYHSLAVIDTLHNFYLAGDLDGSRDVDLLDFSTLYNGWTVRYTFADVLEMANNWLVDCDADPFDLACMMLP